MCSKKCANPDLPGSTSLRDPVCTGIWSETMLGKPVSTTMTFRRFGSVFSVTGNGKMSPEGAAFLRAAGLAAVDFFWPVAVIAVRASRIAATARNRVMKSPSLSMGRFYLRGGRREVRRPLCLNVPGFPIAREPKRFVVAKGVFRHGSFQPSPPDPRAPARDRLARPHELAAPGQKAEPV